ncbi:GNAT family N-acetyltransferase [Streptomyces sp. NBC_00654]|uniref:GNAT family N-acetyltransferase n=1 Tax=Streptomyces sp. NBC_00654 TaxID=2975799 RepID=UPI0022582EEB|nr:N-acetyltransferase [Streptomyces sp. NBC_00654]MCX4967847.1 GNAT family N-acetyltransferase [Streptomyces sp. NBC_00654]
MGGGHRRKCPGRGLTRSPAKARAEIKRLRVDPPARGRGVAPALVEGALTHAAKSGGGHRLRLSVWSRLTGAVALYERAGFTAVGSWDARDGLVRMEHA